MAPDVLFYRSFFESNVMTELDVREFLALSRANALIDPTPFHFEKRCDLFHCEKIVKVVRIAVSDWLRKSSMPFRCGLVYGNP